MNSPHTNFITATTVRSDIYRPAESTGTYLRVHHTLDTHIIFRVSGSDKIKMYSGGSTPDTGCIWTKSKQLVSVSLSHVLHSEL